MCGAALFLQRPAQEHRNSLQGCQRISVGLCEISPRVICESPSQLPRSISVTLGVSLGPIEEKDLIQHKRQRGLIKTL